MTILPHAAGSSVSRFAIPSGRVRAETRIRPETRIRGATPA